MGATIYYFSATGNSLRAAKTIAKNLGDAKDISMAEAPPQMPVGGVGETVGFVFPVYYWDLPRRTEAFVRQLDIVPGTYCFAVATMGLVGGMAMAFLGEILKEKGIKLSYSKGVPMVRNYIVEYNPPKPGSAVKDLVKAEGKIIQIAEDIKLQKKNRTRKWKMKMSGRIHKNIETLDEAFYAEDHCVHCGLCQRVCPVSNIKLENGVPQWLHHCEHCMACIHWCPVEAIQYGKKTKKRNRYHHPDIKVEELCRASQEEDS